VRVLRVARFAARFEFDIAPETYELLRAMVENGEVDALVPERVWQELARGVMEKRPARMLEVLREVGALQRIAPELGALFETPEAAQCALDALDAAAQKDASLEVRVAALARALEPYAVDRLADRLKLPADVRELAMLAARHGNTIEDAGELDAESLLELLNAADAWRRPDRFEALIEAAGAGGRARSRLNRARAAAAAVDAGAIARLHRKSDDIKHAVNAARLDAIRVALASS
jgi:tRNA nucleotidyltransferase (CCA-adding enzyme)